MFKILMGALLSAFCLVASGVEAGVIRVEVGSSGAVQNLVVGQTAEILVVLDGLASGQELDTLAATVVYDAALLGTPSITAGAIVPDPLYDSDDFNTDEAAGLADATFLTFGTESDHHIGSNGTFFSFDVTALAVGEGSLVLNFVDATQFNPDNPSQPILLTPEAGPALAFSVVVPEPTGLTLILLLAAGLGARWAVRKRRH